MRLISDDDLLAMMAPEDGGLFFVIAGNRFPGRFFDGYQDTVLPSGTRVEGNTPMVWCRTVDTRFVSHDSQLTVEEDDGSAIGTVYRVRKIERMREGQTMLELSEVRSNARP